MNLIIHVGEPKTGSTSIQHSLARSSQDLAKYGVLYYANGNNGHAELTYLLGRRHRVRPSMHEALLSKAKGTIAMLHKMAQDKSYTDMVLSSEYFFNFSENNIADFTALMPSRVKSTSCIVYIRPPVDLFASNLQQIVKASHVLPSPMLVRKNPGQQLLNWQNAVGKARFYPAIFHQSTLQNSDIIDDFASKLWAVACQRNGAPNLCRANANTTLMAEQICILHEFRRDYLSDFDNQLMPESDAIISLFTEVNRIKEIGTRPALKPEVVAAITLANKEYINIVDEILETSAFSDLCKRDNLPFSSISGTASHGFASMHDYLEEINVHLYQIQKNLVVVDVAPSKQDLDKWIEALELRSEEKVKFALLSYLKYLERMGVAEGIELELSRKGLSHQDCLRIAHRYLRS